MQPNFSYGNAGTSVSPYAMQPPGYASGLQWSPAGMPPAPMPSPSLNFTGTAASAGGAVAAPSIPQDSLTSALNTAINTPVDAAPMGWGDSFKGLFRNEDGFNMKGIGALAKGIGGLGSLWMGFQQNRLAKDALNFQKESYATNLANSIGSYNMALEDRVRSRYAQEGRSDKSAERYISKHKLEE